MVIFGLTYNFIPFMALPIYASLERLDLRYLEAGRRSVRESRDHLLARDPAAVAARGGVGHAADLHPGHRRLREREPAVPRAARRPAWSAT